MNRYENMFAGLRAEKQIAFVPFMTLGDQGFKGTLEIVDAFIESGSDALELGIPFSDPLADGPTIQESNQRALKEHVTTDVCFSLIKEIRSKHPKIPIGLLVYGNIVFVYGADRFYQMCAEVGVDSVLVADLPVRHRDEFVSALQNHKIDSVFVAPPNASDEDIQLIAENSGCYVYMVSRQGVTGAENQALMPNIELIRKLKSVGSAPCLLGFGISTPEHVTKAKASGVDGVICGSAVVKIIATQDVEWSEKLDLIKKFIKEMKKNT